MGDEPGEHVVEPSQFARDPHSEVAGRRKDQISIMFKDQGEANAPYTTFASRPNGYLVIRRGTAVTTDYTASQTVHVFPVQAGDRQHVPVAINEVLKFQVPFFITGTVQESVALT